VRKTIKLNRTLHREVEELKTMLLSQGSLVEDRLRKACRVIESKDEKLTAQIIRSDWEVDEMEIRIEEECLKILALHQPVAKDLRLLVAIVKINNELERIGDIAVNIAKRVQTINKDSTLTFKIDFSTMANKVLSMLKISLDALVGEESSLARTVFLEDDAVDEIRDKTYKSVVKELDTQTGHAACLLNIYLLAGHLERIADRTTNIAEEVIYLVEGEIVRNE